MNGCALALLIAACSGDKPRAPGPIAEPKPTQAHELCITNGTVGAPAVRGYARGSTGDSATLAFTYDGVTATTSALASGATRAQLGLKLRAQNSCNVIYVMWRVSPKSEITVQVKANPGSATHEDCGITGYTRVKAAVRKPPPALEPNTQHTLAAAIERDELVVWADHEVVWRGTLPAPARNLTGPAGFRIDNVKAKVSLDGVTLANAIARSECLKPQSED
ncbi:MAG TPA: hypothetical protein VIV11_29005 [Kofleriaceae bacterium]